LLVSQLGRAADGLAGRSKIMAEPGDPQADYDVLLRKLESISPLADVHKQCILDLPLVIKEVGPDQDIVREGSRPSACCLLIEGFACRYKLTDEGKRQIFSFHTPGDIPDLQSLHLKVMDHSLKTITPCKLAFIPHENVHELTRQCPQVADVLWRDTLVDAAIFREWMLGIGRRSAYARIAHLLCEVFTRLRAVGLTDGFECAFPITQHEIGDALGLSTVHVNRSVQELRADGLIEMRRGRLIILNWDGFQKAGEFDPTYLHLSDDAHSRMAQGEHSSDQEALSKQSAAE
jgi:CRP-like cAMP-binding protein